MARLFVLSGASVGSTFDIDGSTLLGRGDEVDVVLREPSISRKHARMAPQPEPGVWKVVDLDSSNGLHFGGRRVREAIVRDGETFMLGEIEIRLRDEALESAPEEAPEHDLDGGFELEFGDDIERELAHTPRPAVPSDDVAPDPAQRPSAPDRSGARATQERAARRAAAIGSAGTQAAGARSGPADAGKPVLQYNRKEGRGTDLNQLPGGLRRLLILAAVAVALGVAYGAFTLTRTARSQSSALTD